MGRKKLSFVELLGQARDERSSLCQHADGERHRKAKEKSVGMVRALQYVKEGSYQVFDVLGLPMMAAVFSLLDKTEISFTDAGREMFAKMALGQAVLVDEGYLLGNEAVVLGPNMAKLAREFFDENKENVMTLALLLSLKLNEDE